MPRDRSQASSGWRGCTDPRPRIARIGSENDEVDDDKDGDSDHDDDEEFVPVVERIDDSESEDEEFDEDQDFADAQENVKRPQ